MSAFAHDFLKKMGLITPKAQIAEDINMASKNTTNEDDFQLRCLMRGLRRGNPAVEELLRNMAVIAQITIPSTSTESSEPTSGQVTVRESDLEFFDLTSRFKKEGWTEEKYTQELVALRECRRGKVQQSP
ncbi:unnamed protein product [Discula destructiva]